MEPSPPYREPPPVPSAPRFSRLRELAPHLFSLALGVGYGVCARVAFGARGPSHAADSSSGWFGVMTASFLFGVPFVIGVVFTLRYPRDFPLRWTTAIGGAIACSLIAVAATMVLAIEGLICVAMATPIFVLLAGLGGLVGWGVHKLRARSAASRGALLSVAGALPFLLAPVEHLAAPPVSAREVRNEIRVHASPAAVWREIKSVPRIDRAELPWTLSHAIGLPRPLAATLSQDGVGGVRTATFERGLAFREVVTRWEPEHALAFSIHADAVPPTALDEHVTVGGPYFDVLEGTYTLEVVGPQEVVLHLSSRQRLSTRFNAYAALWTDFVMHDLQQAILEVVRRRCEAHPAG